MIDTKTYTENLSVLNNSGLNYSGNSHGILIKTRAGNIMFYATKNKYVYKNKSYTGDAKDVIQFIKRLSRQD